MQVRGDTHGMQSRSIDVFIAAGRATEIATTRFDFTDQAPGVRQGRDRLEVRQRARNQLERFNTGGIEAMQRRPQGLGHRGTRLAAGMFGRSIVI